MEVLPLGTKGTRPGFMMMGSSSVVQLLDVILAIAQDPTFAASPELDERMTQISKCLALEVMKATQDKHELEVLRQQKHQDQEELREARQLLWDLQQGGEQTTARLRKEVKESKFMLAQALADKQAAEKDKAQGLAQLEQVAEAKQQELRTSVQHWKTVAGTTKQEMEALHIASSKTQSSFEVLVAELRAGEETRLTEMATAQAEAAGWKARAEAAAHDMAAAALKSQSDMLALETAFKSDVSSAQSKIDILESEVARLTAASDQAVEESSNSQASLGKLQAREEALEGELTEFKNNLAHVKKAADATRRELEETRRELEESREKESQMQSSLRDQDSQLQSLLDEARAQVTTLREQLSRLKTESKSGEAAWQAQVTATREELARWKTAAETAKEESSKAQDSFKVSLAGLRDREATLQRDLTASKGAEVAAQTTLTVLQDKANESQSLLEEALSELRAREAALAATSKEMADWKASAEAAQAKTSEIQAALASLDASMLEGRGRETALHEELTALKEQMSSAHGELAQWKAAADTAREEASKMQVSHEASLITAQKELERWKAEAETVQQKVADLQASLDEADAREEQLKSDLLSFRSEMEQAKAMAESAHTETRTRQSFIETSLAEAESREAALKSEVARTNKELERVTLAAQSAEEDNVFLLTEAREYAAGLQIELANAKKELKHWQTMAEAAQQECETQKADKGRLQLRMDEYQGMAEQEPMEQTVVPLARSLRAPPGRIFLIETGAWHIRAGWMHVGASPASFKARHFPCVVARPKDESADLMDIVQNAGQRAGAMYNQFRKMGVFIGKDAWYCAFDHPDPVLRGALKLETPFVRDRLVRKPDLQWLWKDVLDKMGVDTSETSMVITYKPTSTTEERAAMVEAFFGLNPLGPAHVRFVNEATVLTSVGKVGSALVIDIGEEVTRVVPVYEEMVLEKGIQAAVMGGADLTNYMAYMLLSLRNEVYASLVDRKRLEIARRIKEQHAYVSTDFERETEVHGVFMREKIDVMKFHRAHIATEESAVPGRCLDMATMPESGNEAAEAGIKAAFRTRLSDGQELALTVSRERFHCGELLFRPELYPEAAPTVSLVDLVRQSLKSIDEEAWPDVLQHVVVAGQTSRLPGLVDRLAVELKAHLPANCTGCLKVMALEEPKLRPMDDSGNIDPDEASVSLSSSSSLSLGNYTTAVSRGVVGQAAKLVAEQKYWVDEQVYEEHGDTVLMLDPYKYS